MRTVAIATECDDFDAEVYRVLLELLLGEPIERWKNQFRFSGWKNVCALASVYLEAALAEGVQHALVAIDNDGGSKRRPEHQPTHDAKAEAANPEDGCGFCLLSESTAGSAMPLSCLVVPVQTMETWLLVLRGDDMGAEPERVHHRRVLKKQFFGKPLPPVATRTDLALEQIRRPDALDILRRRPSFALFEAQLTTWR